MERGLSRLSGSELISHISLVSELWSIRGLLGVETRARTWTERATQGRRKDQGTHLTIVTVYHSQLKVVQQNTGVIWSAFILNEIKVILMRVCSEGKYDKELL